MVQRFGASRSALRPHRQGSGFSVAAGQKTAGQIEKETNSSPRSSQRTPRKIRLNDLCNLFFVDKILVYR